MPCEAANTKVYGWAGALHESTQPSLVKAAAQAKKTLETFFSTQAETCKRTT